MSGRQQRARRLSKTVTVAQKWRSYGQGAEGYDALCEAGPKPQVWLNFADERNEYPLCGPAAGSYRNDGKNE